MVRPAGFRLVPIQRLIAPVSRDQQQQQQINDLQKSLNDYKQRYESAEKELLNLKKREQLLTQKNIDIVKKRTV